MQTLLAKHCLLALLASSALLHAHAEIRLPALFGDNMILQQDTQNAIWGFADPGEQVQVHASWGASAQTQADQAGNWKLMLATPAHQPGAPHSHSLTIAGDNTLTFNNVALGEVWLAAGQSNMGWAMQNTFSAEATLAQADNPDLRIYRSQRQHWHEPLLDNASGQWQTATPATVAQTSAVAYHFAATLQRTLKVPVGIIVQAYAGTPIEGWIPKTLQQDDPAVTALIADMDRRSRRFDRTQALETYQQQLTQYRAELALASTAPRRQREPKPPIITKPANLGHQMPGHIYNAMIHPIRPYGIKGMIWYQGERNSKNVAQALNYRRQLAQLVGYYRQSWHEMSDGNVAADLPVYFTQLPSWNPPQTLPVEGVEAPWAVNREMMRLASEELPNTGLAVAIDTGDAVELHPKNKRPIGLRHAALALSRVYGFDTMDTGPRLTGTQVAGDRLVLSFEAVGQGLMAAKDAPLDSFAIAGDDQQWHWAEAEILGDKIRLSSPAVPRPVAARYAWAMNPSQRNLLYNHEGFPASPFRTDDWPLFDPDKPLVQVHKPTKPDGYRAQDWPRPTMQP
ncbi:sialate O-acetylesterase [Ferrimonas pelagia]|uniref:Sialate O-acetylesterase n=1 Tax=Ferrimonas pelagia TaxID=1177826 RepID=A0ABP9F3A3_9GAMM